MPFYDYNCVKCDYVLKDVQRKITDDVGTFTCPACGKAMKQWYSGHSRIEFKGNGFYETDYRKKTVKKDDAKT